MTQKPHGEPPTGPTHASTGDRSFFERRNESGLVELVSLHARQSRPKGYPRERFLILLGSPAKMASGHTRAGSHTQLPTPGKEFYYGVPRRSTDGVPVNAAPLSRHGHSLKRIPRKIFFFKRGRGVHAGERVPAHSQRGRGGVGHRRTGNVTMEFRAAMCCPTARLVLSSRKSEWFARGQLVLAHEMTLRRASSAAALSLGRWPPHCRRRRSSWPAHPAASS